MSIERATLNYQESIKKVKHSLTLIKVLFILITGVILSLFIYNFTNTFGLHQGVPLLVQDIEYVLSKFAIVISQTPLNTIKMIYYTDQGFQLLSPSKYVNNHKRTIKKRATFYKTHRLLLLFYLGLPVLIIRLKKGKKTPKKRYLRGSKIASLKEMKKLLKSRCKDKEIPITPTLRIPYSAETTHVFAIGKTGAGKTQLFLKAIQKALKERGEKGIIYDYKGDYVSFFKREKDIIFNPFDTRSIQWSIFNEIETEIDIDNISQSFIPDETGTKDPFWNKAARDVFSSILYYCVKTNQRTHQELWDLLVKDPIVLYNQLKTISGCEDGMKYIAKSDSSQTHSILSVMNQHVRVFKYMRHLKEGSFSIREWVKNDQDKRTIFLNSSSELDDALRGVFTAFIDTVGRTLITLPNSQRRRLFFFIDEFGTLKPLSMIKKLLTLSRSKGGSIFLGVQDIGQLEELYGEKITNTIVSATSNMFMFVSLDLKTAHFMSKKIGEREIEEERNNQSYQPKKEGMSIGKSQNTKCEDLVLSSEIMNLKELEFYCKLNNLPLTKDILRYTEWNGQVPPFIQRDGLVISSEEWGEDPLFQDKKKEKQGALLPELKGSMYEL